MQVAETEIADIKLIKPIRHVDSRGFFSEVFKENVLRDHGIDVHLFKIIGERLSIVSRPQLPVADISCSIR